MHFRGIYFCAHDVICPFFYGCVYKLEKHLLRKINLTFVSFFLTMLMFFVFVFFGVGVKIHLISHIRLEPICCGKKKEDFL